MNSTRCTVLPGSAARPPPQVFVTETAQFAVTASHARDHDSGVHAAWWGTLSPGAPPIVSRPVAGLRTVPPGERRSARARAPAGTGAGIGNMQAVRDPRPRLHAGMRRLTTPPASLGLRPAAPSASPSRRWSCRSASRSSPTPGAQLPPRPARLGGPHPGLRQRPAGEGPPARPRGPTSSRFINDVRTERDGFALLHYRGRGSRRRPASTRRPCPVLPRRRSSSAPRAPALRLRRHPYIGVGIYVAETTPPTSRCSRWRASSGR